MYRQYFDLRANPFKIEPDPEFLWLGEKHLEGLATLQYGILENKGFLLLTGDVGTGKTVLIHHLKNNLPRQVKVAAIPDPGIEILDLYRILSADFQIGSRFEGKANFLIQFKRFLIEAYAAQQQLLIIIDEAHRLSCELLDEIRVLSNIDYENRKLINIFFVGQDEFSRMLMDRRNQAVRQRIAVSYHLSPLDDQETPAYIRHRLKVAGSEKDLFTPEALSEVCRLSGGTPRLINIICDRALMTGYVKELKQIGADTIRECATELDVSLGIPAPVSGKIYPMVTRPAERDGPEKLLKRNRPWLIVALVGMLGVLTYFSLSIRPSVNVGPDGSAVAVNENTGGRTPAADKSPAGRPLPARSEGLTAKTNRPPLVSKDPAHPALESAPTAVPMKGKTDQPAVVIRKRDPWEKMPVEKSGLESADQNSTTAGAPHADENTGPEIVSAWQSAAPTVQRFYVLFKPGSAELENSSFDVLMQVSQLLSAYPNSRITLASFSDSTAKAAYTSKLLALRANCVKSFLTSRGIGARLTVVSSSAESLPETNRPPAMADMESWSEIRIETGREG